MCRFRDNNILTLLVSGVSDVMVAIVSRTIARWRAVSPSASARLRSAPKPTSFSTILVYPWCTDMIRAVWPLSVVAFKSQQDYRERNNKVRILWVFVYACVCACVCEERESEWMSCEVQKNLEYLYWPKVTTRATQGTTKPTGKITTQDI